MWQRDPTEWLQLWVQQYDLLVLWLACLGIGIKAQALEGVVEERFADPDAGDAIFHAVINVNRHAILTP